MPPTDRASTPVRAIAHALPEVPESLTLQPLLDQLRRPGAQMALVVDEWGGSAGIVTLEDVLEELVGEVDDEHDIASTADPRQPDGTYLLSGLTRVHEAERLAGFGPRPGPYDTLGGLIMNELGRVPTPDDVVEVDAWSLQVVSIDGLRVDSVRLVPPPAAEAT